MRWPDSMASTGRFDALPTPRRQNHVARQRCGRHRLPVPAAAGAVVAGLRKSLTIDDLKKIINRPPRTLAELADKIRNFWSQK